VRKSGRRCHRRRLRSRRRARERSARAALDQEAGLLQRVEVGFERACGTLSSQAP
jgi:hypothetical protein